MATLGGRKHCISIFCLLFVLAYVYHIYVFVNKGSSLLYSNLTRDSLDIRSNDRRPPIVELGITNSVKNLGIEDVASSRWSHPEHPQAIRLEGQSVRSGAYHARSLFLLDYRNMMKSFKVYVYPYPRGGTYGNIFLHEKETPSGNYASEAFFKKALMESELTTGKASEAHLFYLPFSIAGIRGDTRLGVHAIPGFIAEYMQNITEQWPYWNRSRGANHFYVACHSISKIAMDRANHVARNAIQAVCSSNYFSKAYIPHKDIPIPQIWPREGPVSDAASTAQRNKLAFFAGGANSPVRALLVDTWHNDSDIIVHPSRISTPYSQALLTSKFCLHVKGYEVNTARIGDALFYGCVPVIIADHYELPFLNVLNWSQFSIIITVSDIPRIKEILAAITIETYADMHQRVMEVRHHFLWHSPPVEYDAFYMVMYELWLRRHSLRGSLVEPSLTTVH